MVRVLTWLVLLFTLLGCAQSVAIDPGVEMQQKLSRVVAEAIRLTEVEDEKRLLRGAKHFQNLEGLDIGVAGFIVSPDQDGPRIFVSFTLEYIKSNDVEVLAAEGLQDLRMALKSKEHERGLQ